MFALKVGNKYLGIPDGQTFTLVKNSELFSTDLPEGEYSYPINLNLQDKNVSDFFSSFRNIQSVKNFKSVDCQIYFKKQPLENNARLVFRRRKANIIQGYVLTGSSLFAQALKNTKINEIDYGSYDMGEDHQDAINHMLDTVINPQNYNHVFATLYAPNFKNNFETWNEFYSNVINSYNFIGEVFLKNTSYFAPHSTAYVPFLKLAFVLKSIYQHFGYTLDWPELDNTDLSKVIIANNAELTEAIEIEPVRASSNLEIVTPNDINITDWEKWYEGGTAGNISGITAEIGPLPNALPWLRFEDDFTLPNQDPLDFFNMDGENTVIDQTDFTLMQNSYFHTQPNNEYLITVDITFQNVENLNISAYLFNLIIQVFINNQLVGILSTPELENNNNEITISESFTFMAPEQPSVGNMKFKATIMRTFLTALAINNPFHDDGFGTDYSKVFSTIETTIKSYSFKIELNNPAPVYKLKQEIVLNQHLSDDTCSDFLNNIRKRFGAYVSNIDFANRVISFRLLKDVEKSRNSKPSFKNRNVIDEFEASFHKYIFEEEFEDEKLITDSQFIAQVDQTLIKSKDFGIDENDFEEVTTNLKYSPLLDYYFKYAGNEDAILPAFGHAGILAGSEPAKMRLSMYHGKQAYSTANLYQHPLVRSFNYNILNQKISDFNLLLSDEEGLWFTFWKKWYEKFYLKEKYKFEIIPDLIEIKEFKFDVVDFYQFAEFLCKKVDFKLQNNKILKSKFEVVKLNR